MPIKYPAGLPRGLKQGRSYQLVSPLKRSSLVTGRAIQRRGFTDVPMGASVSWIFNDEQARAFESWWRDALIDGSQWFDCPLDTPFGFEEYPARFTDVYSGPTVAGYKLWSYSAQLELNERPSMEPEWGLFPEFVLDSSIFDLAMNRKWPRHRTYALTTNAGELLTTEDGFGLTTE